MKKRNRLVWVSAAAFVVVSFTPRVRSTVSETYEGIKLLVDILRNIQEKYVEPVDQKTLVYGAAAGMVRALDPFSQFMEPEAHKEMKTETEGAFGGIGIRIGVKDGWLVVIAPMPDTPAYRLGILTGDKIVKIEGQSTQGLGINDAVNKLRGKPNTKVTITVFREGEKNTHDFTITRELIKIPSVKYKMLNDNIGYIRLSEFIATSVVDISKALKDLQDQGMTSLVFDLRNNPGGLLNSAVDVCKLFLGQNKLIVYTQGRAPDSREDFLADARAPYENVPIALLVNHGSASGSEIVSGAFQDQKRAILIGGETFGKGSVQSVLPLDDGAGLRLTTAKYYTPSGRLIHRNEKTGKGGVSPDIVIEVPREIEAKLQIQSDDVPPKDKKSAADGKEPERIKDEVLERAVEILKARAVFEKLK